MCSPSERVAGWAPLTSVPPIRYSPWHFGGWRRARTSPVQDTEDTTPPPCDKEVGGTNQDTRGATAKTPGPRPGRRPGHHQDESWGHQRGHGVVAGTPVDQAWIPAGTPPGQTKGGRGTHARRKPRRPPDNARSFACTSLMTRTGNTTPRSAGSLEDSLPQPPTPAAVRQ